MVEADIRVGVRPTKRGLVCSGVAVMLIGLGASACSGGHRDRPPAAARSTTTTLSVTDQQVIQGWKAAEEAFYSATYTSDASSPALAATMVNPELNQARTLLFAEQHDGYVGKGTYNLGQPRVTSVDGSTAVVVSCIYGGVIEVNAKTGKPAPAPFGVAEKEQEHATMIQVSGLWKESQLSVTDGTCAGS